MGGGEGRGERSGCIAGQFRPGGRRKGAAAGLGTHTAAETCARMAPSVKSRMFRMHRAHRPAKDRHGFCGLRVAPHVFNTFEEIDLFVAALQEVTATDAAAL